MPVQTYRKRPVEIEAIQFTEDNQVDVLKFLDGNYRTNTQQEIVVETIEGPLTARVGDYVIKGVEGEFYPCKSSVFEQTYDQVGTPEAV